MNVFPSGYVPPVPQSSLTLLFRAVQAWFTAYQVDAAVYLGLKYRDLQDQPRVILIDGEFDGTLDPRPRSAGRFRAPWQKKSDDPRELAQYVAVDFSSFYWSDPAARQAGFEVWGY